jgi:hypothetical protein
MSTFQCWLNCVALFKKGRMSANSRCAAPSRAGSGSSLCIVQPHARFTMGFHRVPLNLRTPCEIVAAQASMVHHRGPKKRGSLAPRMSPDGHIQIASLWGSGGLGRGPAGFNRTDSQGSSSCRTVEQIGGRAYGSGSVASGLGSAGWGSGGSVHTCRLYLVVVDLTATRRPVAPAAAVAGIFRPVQGSVLRLKRNFRVCSVAAVVAIWPGRRINCTNNCSPISLEFA